MADEFTYWLPPSAVKQSGKTRIAGPIAFSCTRRAARSGTFSLKFFQATCARPEPVKPTMSTKTGKRLPRPRVAPSSYSAGSHTASLRACGSPSGLPARIFESCSRMTTVPVDQRGRLSAIALLLQRLQLLRTRFGRLEDGLPDGLRHVDRLRATAQVGRVHLARGDALDRVHEPPRAAVLSQVVEHHRGGPESRDRVCDSLPGDVDGRA